MNCKDALPLMHEYMDGDLSGIQTTELKKHVLSCPACNQRFKQMQNAEALVRSLPKVAPSSDLTARIMLSLPKAPKRNSWLRWVKQHPAISVASMFVFIMLGSFASLWNQDQEMVVKGADLDQVVIKGDMVYVPAGHTVNGNLMVKRGTIQVDGEIKGNLVVIDGNYNYLASTGHISGKIKKVDQALEWVWFEVNEYASLFAK